MKLIKTCVAGILLLAVVCVQHVCAAPFAKTIEFTQPGGQIVQLWGEGDDFYAVFETLDGYTVIFDQTVMGYCYAAVNADGDNLVSTGLLVGRDGPGALEKHIRLSAAAVKALAGPRQKQWELETGIRERWDALKEVRSSFESALSMGPIVMAPPSWHTLGQITGLTLLVDFDAAPATISQSEIIKFCNQPGYTGYSNNGSVRDYFYDVSDGMLEYTNVVTAYVRIPNSLHPKSYYTDPARDAGSSGRELINDAFAILKSHPDYATLIAPAIDQISIKNGEALALNVFYAGGNGDVWAMGLWPHKSNLGGSSVQLTARTKVNVYQITNIGGDLAIGTFCHENGHMICDFPDLYDYDYDSVGGAGQFCLMGSGGHGKNPSQVCAYLKYAAGWTATTDVIQPGYLAASLSGVAGNPKFNQFYRVKKSGVETEYYLFEARRKSGRDLSLPGQGVLIWHVDELGNRDDQRREYNTNHENYECSLVQADNQFHFQTYANDGDANDPWYAGKGAFSDSSAPSARWWDGSRSRLRATDFSIIGDVMTFIFLPSAPVLQSAAGPLPDGREWAYYNYGIGAYSEETNIFWSITSGALPDGLAMDANGVIAGYPTLKGTYNFGVVCSNLFEGVASASYSITILPVHTAPFYEGFDLSDAMPDSWVQEYPAVSNTAAWKIGTKNNLIYPESAKSPWNMAILYTVTTNNVNTWLVTPRIDFGENGRAGRIKFNQYMAHSLSGKDELRVHYKTDMAAEWTLLTNYTDSVTLWKERVIDLPAISRSVYVAFEGIARGGYGICVDSVNIWDPTPPYAFVTASHLPNAIINEPYEVTLTVEGGYEPYTFTDISNSLPVGMTLSTNGVISGTASAVQLVYPLIQVRDAQSNTLEKTYSLLVTMPVVNLLAEGFENNGLIPPGWTMQYVAYSTPWLFASGGGGDLAHPFRAYEGSFNAVLYAADRNPSDGTHNVHVTRLISPPIDLSQMPDNLKLYFWHCMEEYGSSQDTLKILYRTSAAGAWLPITNAVFDANTPVWIQRSVALPNPSSTYYIAFEGYAQFGYGICLDNIKITNESSAPVITTPDALPVGLINVNYDFTFAAKGGVEKYTWAVTVGTLPFGMNLSTNGVLSGIPLEAYNADIYVAVTGLDGFAATNRFRLNIRDSGGLPFFEDFEHGGAMPEYWEQETGLGSASWVVANGTSCTDPTRKPVSAYSGSGNASLFNASNTRMITRLVTPMLDMSGGVSNAVLTFRHQMQVWSGYQDTLTVCYKNSRNGDWIPLNNFSANTVGWTERSVALPDATLTGTYFIAFEGRVNWGYGVCIDDVRIDGDLPLSPLSPYEQWQQSYFSPVEIAAGIITGDDDDPDHDGIGNIWEYAFGLDPRDSDASGTPTGGIFNQYLQLSYRQSIAAADYDFVVEACTDLIVGDWSTNDISEISRNLSTNDSNQSVYWSVTTRHDLPVTNAPTRFMRLKLMPN